MRAVPRLYLVTSDAQMRFDHNITSVIKRVHLRLRVGCRMSTRNETTRRDKARAKLAATKKEKKKKEPITDTCPAYAIAEIYDANYIFRSLYSLPHRGKFPQDLLGHYGGNYCCVHV